MYYAGRILRVDLEKCKVSHQIVNEEIAKKYIGGVGLAARILWKETSSNTDPFSPENRLVFMTGPLTGTIVPKSGRFVVVAISPLTDIWGESHAGGTWAHALRRSGVDGIVIKGVAEHPVYLWISDKEAKIEDAHHLWGKDIYETDELLKKETDKAATTVAIGPAGEKLVRFASVIGDGRAGRAAARTGMGAVMGSKKLKAIAVRGTRKILVYDEEGLERSVRNHYPITRLTPEEIERLERQEVHTLFSYTPHKNFRQDILKGLEEKCADAVVRGRLYYCAGCDSSCTESHMMENARRIMVQGLRAFGAGCLIDNVEAMDKAWELCQRLGMDVTSTGAVIAFAMECFEKGLINRRELEGINLEWGNHDAVVEMVRKIGQREGFGKVLGEGVRRAADYLGGMAHEYAMHVKGFEISPHDPRAHNGLALGMAVANRGASNLEAPHFSFNSAIPDLSITEEQLDNTRSAFVIKGQGVTSAKLQNLMCVVDSLIVCSSLATGLYEEEYRKAQPSHLLEWLNLATGWKMNLDEFMTIGERIYNLKRLINVRRGISRKDDTLPPRLLTAKRGRGAGKDNLPHLGRMLNEFYSFRGWSEEGIPTEDKLTQLGLSREAEGIY